MSLITLHSAILLALRAKKVLKMILENKDVQKVATEMDKKLEIRIV